jgi:hypothetical protein
MVFNFAHLQEHDLNAGGMQSPPRRMIVGTGLVNGGANRIPINMDDPEGVMSMVN